MKPGQFTYHVPRTVEEAVALLGEHAGSDGRIIAGGQSLVPTMALRRSFSPTPSSSRQSAGRGWNPVRRSGGVPAARESRGEDAAETAGDEDVAATELRIRDWTRKQSPGTDCSLSRGSAGFALSDA